MTTTTPQTLPISDEQIEVYIRTLGAKWNGDAWSIEDADLYPMVRSIITLAAQTQAVAENIREGAPYDDPRFEALCREHGIWGTAQAALCAVFWRQAVAMPAIPEQDRAFEIVSAWLRHRKTAANGAQLASMCELAMFVLAASPQAAGQQEATKDDEIKRLTNELRYIANADVASWDDPSEFRAWAQNRARAAITNSKDES